MGSERKAASEHGTLSKVDRVTRSSRQRLGYVEERARGLSKQTTGMVGGAMAYCTWNNGLFTLTPWWLTQLNIVPPLPHAIYLCASVMSSAMVAAACMLLAANCKYFAPQPVKAKLLGAEKLHSTLIRRAVVGSVACAIVLLLHIGVKLCGLRSTHVMRCVAVALILLQMLLLSVNSLQSLFFGSDVSALIFAPVCAPLCRKYSLLSAERAAEEDKGNSSTATSTLSPLLNNDVTRPLISLNFDEAIHKVVIVLLGYFFFRWTQVAMKTYGNALASMGPPPEPMRRELVPDTTVRSRPHVGVFKFSIDRWTIMRTLPPAHATTAVLASPIAIMLVTHILVVVPLRYYVFSEQPDSAGGTWDLLLVVTVLVVVIGSWIVCATLSGRGSHKLRKHAVRLALALMLLSILLNGAAMVWRGVKLSHQDKAPHLWSDFFMYHWVVLLLNLLNLPSVIMGYIQAHVDAAHGVDIGVTMRIFALSTEDIALARISGEASTQLSTEHERESAAHKDEDKQREKGAKLAKSGSKTTTKNASRSNEAKSNEAASRKSDETQHDMSDVLANMI